MWLFKVKDIASVFVHFGTSDIHMYIWFAPYLVLVYLVLPYLVLVKNANLFPRI